MQSTLRALVDPLFRMDFIGFHLDFEGFSAHFTSFYQPIGHSQSSFFLKQRMGDERHLAELLLGALKAEPQHPGDDMASVSHLYDIE